MVGKAGQCHVFHYEKPKDKKNNFYVDDDTSFRNKKRIWRKLLQKEKNVK